ncbi:MAG TPA: hypothetical protein VHZ81_14460 [Galbitalea sp.]|jgi:hypothetical protein|nr:hypothetical protein [Galbitalea sp.]
MVDDQKYRAKAEKEVASIKPGDTPSQVESKVLGPGAVSETPPKSAPNAEGLK